MTKLYRHKQKYIAYQVNFDKNDEPDWLKNFINTGAIYYQGGGDPYYTIDLLTGLSIESSYAHAGDWLITPSTKTTEGMFILSDSQFRERYEEAEK